MFKTDFSKANTGSEIKPEGNYEVIITKIEEKTTLSGKTGLNFAMVIRNDIPEQKYGNAFLFHTIWKAKEPTEYDNMVKGYMYGQVMAIAKAARLADGKSYESFEEFLKDIINKPVCVSLKHEEYNGKLQERINYFNETKFPECKHAFKTKTTVKKDEFKKVDDVIVNTTTGEAYEEFDDDECPF